MADVAAESIFSSFRESIDAGAAVCFTLPLLFFNGETVFLLALERTMVCLMADAVGVEVTLGRLIADDADCAMETAAPPERTVECAAEDAVCIRRGGEDCNWLNSVVRAAIVFRLERDMSVKGAAGGEAKGDVADETCVSLDESEAAAVLSAIEPFLD